MNCNRYTSQTNLRISYTAVCKYVQLLVPTKWHLVVSTCVHNTLFYMYTQVQTTKLTHFWLRTNTLQTAASCLLILNVRKNLIIVVLECYEMHIIIPVYIIMFSRLWLLLFFNQCICVYVFIGVPLFEGFGLRGPTTVQSPCHHWGHWTCSTVNTLIAKVCAPVFRVSERNCFLLMRI